MTPMTPVRRWAGAVHGVLVGLGGLYLLFFTWYWSL